MSTAAQAAIPRPAARPAHVLALLAGNAALALGPWSVRLADCGPVAAGFWRLFLALPILAILALANRQPLRGFPKAAWLAMAGAGVFFGLHIAQYRFRAGPIPLNLFAAIPPFAVTLAHGIEHLLIGRAGRFAHFAVDLVHLGIDIDLVAEQRLETHPGLLDEADGVVPGVREQVGEDTPGVGQEPDRLRPTHFDGCPAVIENLGDAKDRVEDILRAL